MTSRLIDSEVNKNKTISYSQKPTPYHSLIAKKVLENVSQGKIFDHGCGVGNTLIEIEALAPKKFEFAISDIDMNCLNIAAESLKTQKKFLISSDGKLPQISDQFDVVISSHVLHYDREFNKTLEQLIHLVRPGGIFVLAVPNAMTLPLIANALINKKHSSAPILSWDNASFANLAGELDVSHIDIVTDYVPLPFFTRFKFFKPFEKLLARVFPSFGFSLIAICKID